MRLIVLKFITLLLSFVKFQSGILRPGPEQEKILEVFSQYESDTPSFQTQNKSYLMIFALKKKGSFIHSNLNDDNISRF